MSVAGGKMVVGPAPGSAPAPGSGSVFSASERKLLAGAERHLDKALRLQDWWREARARETFDSRFDLALAHHRPDHSFGFTGEARVEGAAMPVMGNLQRMFYDRPKSPATDLCEAAEWARAQIREFALRYFLRISDFRQPDTLPCSERGSTLPLLRPLSWCEDGPGKASGFGYSQLFYKLPGEDRIHRFSEDRRFEIIDLRKLVEVYEWVLLEVQIFDFQLVLAPGGTGGPQLVLPLSESSHLLLHRDFLVDEERPEEGVLGRYGFGYAFLPDPGESVLAYGPGQFEAAFQTFAFEVREDGRIEAEMIFTADRPKKVVEISLDPMEWGLRVAELSSFGLASELLDPVRRLWQRMPRPPGLDLVSGYIGLGNLLTDGEAGRRLCISKEQLERLFLAQHFRQHHNAVAGSLTTWRQIADWRREEELPRWVVRGVSI